MYETDFIYDGIRLSDFGFIVCDFNFSTGANEMAASSFITFNKVPQTQGKKYNLSSTQYDKCITTTFDICKNPEIYELEEMEISNDEYREIMRWLNRREFLKFSVISENDSEKGTCYFQASFNVTQIKIREKIYGLRLVMETDKPFGYGDMCEIEWEFGTNDINVERILTDISDEIGSIYPKTVIECRESGDLIIKNINEDCETAIKNCSQGEVITIDGDAQIITSSLSLDEHDIATDFNYEFFRIGNSYSNRDNKITVSLPCKINISYYPVIKDIP